MNIFSVDNRERLYSAILFSVGMFGFSIALFIDREFIFGYRFSTYIYRAIILGLSFFFIVHRLGTMRNVPRGMFWIPFFVFWAAYGLRLLADIGFGDGPFSRNPRDFYLFAIGVCMIPSIAFMLLRLGPANARLTYALSLIILSLSCFVNLYYSREMFGRQFGRLQGEEGLNPITFGHLGVSLVILGLYGLLARKNPLAIPRVAYFAPIGMGTFVIGTAGSRSPVLALLICLLLMVYFAIRQGRHLTLAVVTAAGIGLGIWITGFAIQLGSSIGDRLVGTADRIASGEESRLYIYEMAIKDFLSNPLFGHSIEGTFGFYPHNLVIESFMATGVLGGLAFLWLIGYGLWAATRMLRIAPGYAWVAILFVQMLIYSMFSSSIWGHFAFWYALGSVLPFVGRYSTPAASPTRSTARPHPMEVPTQRRRREIPVKGRVSEVIL